MPSSADEMRKLAEERKPRAYYLQLKYKDAHNSRHPQLRWMSDDMANMIGEYDLHNEQKMIPYRDIDYDPFEAFEGNWDTDDIKEDTNLLDVNIWNLSVKKHRPTVGWLLKHQNPNVGLLDAKGVLKVKRHMLFTKGHIIRSLMQNIRVLGWDVSKLWQIYGYAIPVASRPMYGFMIDRSPRLLFEPDFGFGIKYHRTFYAFYDELKEKYVMPKVREQNGSSISYTNYPVFSTHTVIKLGRMLYRRGLTEDYIKANMRVIRWHFYPLKSFQLDLERSVMQRQEAIKLYRAGDKDMIHHNYDAFRYHHKQMKKLRESI